ncbi:hypothetical protein RR48_02331 [Papilio machaon]|uniref:Uncharacterized protein n=1 Tax=Papilio machaon TaxID=76193 RepID=A0A0N1IQB8_PAPMA|nr:hypothetical protein RR48_02331 [Papilio machaon]
MLDVCPTKSAGSTVMLSANWKTRESSRPSTKSLSKGDLRRFHFDSHEYGTN